MNKFELCALPTQMGKTGVAVDRIMAELSNDCNLGDSLHIVFTMNTILNSEQFAHRLNPVENIYGRGSVCVLSSRYSGLYRRALSVHKLMSPKKVFPKVVVMCSNSVRRADCMKIADLCSQLRIFVYFDELHTYVDSSNGKVRSQIEAMQDTSSFKKIFAFTATPFHLWSNTSPMWNSIKIYNGVMSIPDTYVGVKDIKFKCMSLNRVIRKKNASRAEYVTQYVKLVLAKFPNILDPSTRTFIPSHHRTKEHINIVRIVHDQCLSAVVVVLNGRGCCVYYYKTKKQLFVSPLIRSSRSTEINDSIEHTISVLGLTGRPLVVTGMRCVGIGQTLTNERMGSFTSAIISQIGLGADGIYQLFGRLTGRMRGWKTYAKTVAYCPRSIMIRCMIMENSVRNLSTGTGTGGSTSVNMDEYIKIVTDQFPPSFSDYRKTSSAI